MVYLWHLLNEAKIYIGNELAIHLVSLMISGDRYSPMDELDDDIHTYRHYYVINTTSKNEQ